MPAQLLALTEGPSILLDKPILLVGRHPECDIQINSRKISRLHCCIAQVSDYLVVRDLGSTNGIRINGVRLTEGKLLAGDELTIGSNRYNVEWDTVAGKPVPKRPAPPPQHAVPTAPRPVQVASPTGKNPLAKPLPSQPRGEDEFDSCDEPVPIAEPGVAPVVAPRPAIKPVVAVPPPAAAPVPVAPVASAAHLGQPPPISTAKANAYPAAAERPLANGPAVPAIAEPPKPARPKPPAPPAKPLPPELQEVETPIPPPSAKKAEPPPAEPPLPKAAPLENAFSLILPDHLELAPASDEVPRPRHSKSS